MGIIFWQVADLYRGFVPFTRLILYHIKICYNFIEKPEALFSFLVMLSVKLAKIGDCCKQNATGLAVLVVKFLKVK